MWTKRGDYPKDISQEYRTYPQVTANELRSRRQRPKQVKMLTREFIDGTSGTAPFSIKRLRRMARYAMFSLWSFS